MDPRFGAFNITTAVLVGVTVWMLIARLRGIVESNWPLFYYVGVIVYMMVFPGFVDPAWVYSGIVCTLLLRFEFMGGVFLKLIRAIDIIVLAFIGFFGLSAMVF